MSSVAEFHRFAISDVDILVVLELVVEDVVHPDFVNEGGGHVVT